MLVTNERQTRTGLYTMAEVAAAAAVPYQHLYYLIKSGDLARPTHKYGRRYYYNLKETQAIIVRFKKV